MFDGVSRVSIFYANIKNPLLTALMVTTVKVPFDVNVWMVWPPEVVMIPPVEVFDTPSEPSVAYENIATPFPPVPADAPPFEVPPPPPPRPSVPFPAPPDAPFPPPPVPPEPPPPSPPPPPPPAYVTEEPEIEFAVPFPPATPVNPPPFEPFAPAPPPPPPE